MSARFRVWAPEAGSVELEVGDARRPMAKEPTGWWAGDADAIEYAFSVNGGAPLPDPRSPWQPSGVDGRSRRVDHAAFRWTDAGWRPPPLAEAVFYELHVGTFTPAGTFEAAIDHLDHLARLGVTHVELMPVAEFAGARGWGYDGVDLFAPHHAYGGPEGLKRLVDACHARGLAVVIDVVFNHLGPSGNYLERFGPYFTDRYSTPWGKAINLDGAGSGEVRRFLFDASSSWLRDYHADGLRLDAVHAMHDASATHFLAELADVVRALGAQLGRPLAVIAESDANDPRLVFGRGASGHGLDAVWSDDFHHALHALLTGERQGYYATFGSIASLARAYENVYVRPQAAATAGLGGDRFLAYLQNHDQVGNRARGDRISESLNAARLRIGAALVLTSPFVPLLFQGEEWGTTRPFAYFGDHHEPTLAEAVRAGRRAEFASFGWDPASIPDPEAAETFERSKLDWAEPAREPHASILEWYRSLVRLRRSTPDLQPAPLASVRVRFDEVRQWLAVRRGDLEVVCNFAGEARAVPVAATSVVLASANPSLAASETVLPPESVAILRRRE
ncbi:MAG TPA: malto-oligosyltrehalose trehalohydrolase [Planctomycetota bacterium]|nr:malto-oligosyltrehalose trehalohydrolase [Planctomycetota bacterium]